MARYVVTGGPIEHDLQLYQLHDEIDLTEAQAEQLLALGEVMEVAAKTARKARKGAAHTDGEGPQE